MKPSVTIMSIADVELFKAGIGREGSMAVKQFPLETGVPGVDMEFSWNSYEKGYGTPRHKHTFDQVRFALEGDREIKDGYLKPGDCGFYPEGVSYGPQLQTEASTGLGLQFQGAAGIPYLRHDDLMKAQKALEAEGGTFTRGVYTRTLPDGKKITKDGHAACFEYLTGKKIEFPKPRFSTPIVMHSAAAQWTADRKLPGVEHKHLGSFGVRRSGMRFTRLKAGATIPAHVQEDAEIRYLIDGSITYDRKTWQGGETRDVGTYMWIQAGAEVLEIGSSTGGTFFVIELPLLADIAAEQSHADAAVGYVESREPQPV
jgi:quercetin dioxygenase-like cupin family protein